MKYLIFPLVLIFSSHASAGADYMWLCASDYDPRSVVVNLPERGSAQISLGAQVPASLAAFKEEENNKEKSLRFDFNDYKSGFILFTKLKRNKKDLGKFIDAALYDFSETSSGEKAPGTKYKCLEKR
jgi:hypothetical protein